MTSFSNEEAFAELKCTWKAIKEIIESDSSRKGVNLTNYVRSDDSQDWRAGAVGRYFPETDMTADYQAVIDRVANGTYASSGPKVLKVLAHELTNFTMSDFMSSVQ
ncbi:uncharacterized protein L199_005698 [Kwoniella botswanensis]|uniref:uncharacterized protein n=1 Tax=Kwoniella botswanensis TaxID=1268659 RepID=UPI00315CF41C